MDVRQRPEARVAGQKFAEVQSCPTYVQIWFTECLRDGLIYKGMIPSDLPIQPLQTPLPNRADIRANASSADSEALKSVAQDFEAAFIAQMLNHSGLSEAMTSGEGKMASAFGSFYLEQLANQMAADGGFGMADNIYKQLERYASDPEMGSPDMSITQEDQS